MSQAGQIVKELENFCEAEMEKFASEVEATMIANAPIQTGNLKANTFKQKVDKFRYHIGSTPDYAWYQEFGNHSNRGDGYIYPTHAPTNPPRPAALNTQYGWKSRVHEMRKVSHYVSKTVGKYK